MKKLILIIGLCCVWLAGCSSPAATAQTKAVPSGTPSAATVSAPEMVIKLELVGENPYPLGGIPLLLSLQPNVAAPNTNVTITLPSDLALLTGSQAWAGDLKANQGLFLNLVVQIDKLTNPGFIQVDSVSYPKDAPKLVKTYKLYMRPTANGKVEFSQTPFTP